MHSLDRIIKEQAEYYGMTVEEYARHTSALADLQEEIELSERNPAMNTFIVTYSDQSMIDLHIAPYEREFSAETDAEISRLALAWIAGLHGMPENSLTLENPTADFTDVLTASATNPEKIGEVSFYPKEGV